MGSFTIHPKVDQTQEFIEISNDFSNPLELVREAISNSYDAGATEISILFDVNQEYGESVLVITIKDNGSGMDKNGLQAFFDLGNSPRRDDPNTIGEKGHGTKVYFNSRKIEVETVTSGYKYNAIMEEPHRKLYGREIPTVVVNSDEIGAHHETGTVIHIHGYDP